MKKAILIGLPVVFGFAVAMAADTAPLPTPTPKPPVTIKCPPQVTVLQSPGIGGPLPQWWRFETPLKNYVYPFKSAWVKSYPNSDEKSLYCNYAPTGTNIVVDIHEEAPECYSCVVNSDTFRCTWVGC